jgi:hypothetical protein
MIHCLFLDEATAVTNVMSLGDNNSKEGNTLLKEEAHLHYKIEKL